MSSDDKASIDDSWDEGVQRERERIRTKTGRKQRAQELLMHGIAQAIGYWEESDAQLAEAMTVEERDEFRELVHQQADRVARLFGYKEAWGA